MKLVSYRSNEHEHLGFVHRSHIYNLHSLCKAVPDDMLSLLDGGESMMELARRTMLDFVECKAEGKEEIFYEVIAPLPNPASFRDAYAFRQHVMTSRRNRGAAMIPEFNEFPVFYFGNHRSITGPGDILCMPDHLRQLDFELEAAIVIGQAGRNIRASEADDYIAGFTILNDLSARTFQREEMALNLGPAKGKDFASVTGPWLVTPDELSPFLVDPKPGHQGKAYDLPMRCWVNRKLVSEGNLKDMEWTFAEIIERASYGVDLYPGDIIGSGTVGTGCFLELNGSAKLADPEYKEVWLHEGDLVEMEIRAMGHLTNTIRQASDNWSILAEKKLAVQAS